MQICISEQITFWWKVIWCGLYTDNRAHDCLKDFINIFLDSLSFIMLHTYYSFSFINNILFASFFNDIKHARSMSCLIFLLHTSWSYIKIDILIFGKQIYLKKVSYTNGFYVTLSFTRRNLQMHICNFLISAVS